MRIPEDHFCHSGQIKSHILSIIDRDIISVCPKKPNTCHCEAFFAEAIPPRNTEIASSQKTLNSEWQLICSFTYIWADTKSPWRIYIFQ